MQAARNANIGFSSHTYDEICPPSDDTENEDMFDEWSHDEQVVSKIWAHVLEIFVPPASDVNFFDIGGHSLLVPKLHDQLEAIFPGKAVRLVDLFDQSTIQRQVALFSGASKKVMTAIKLGCQLKQQRIQTEDNLIIDKTCLTSLRAAAVGHLKTLCHQLRPHLTWPLWASPQKLIEGYSGIVTTCIERKTLPQNIWVPKCGALENIEDFDHIFWRLSQEEATDMDPQQRLFMEVAYEVLLDAGIDPRDSSKNIGARTGLFVGSANHAYHLHTESVVTDNFLKQNRGFVAPSISARTAYHLNISGPNVTVQTNCASSTVALAFAFDYICLDRCDIVVVGGVSVQLFDGGYRTERANILSARGLQPI